MHILAVSLALFVLPLAATACPSGWKASASPADAASEPRCFLVPPERSTSLRGCVARCARHGGAPACLASQEETDFVTGEVLALHRAEAHDPPNNCLSVSTTLCITVAALATVGTGPHDPKAL